MADQPGFTRVPNDLIDAMASLGNAELRIMLAIARKSIGWDKESDVISYSQFQQLTGLTRRNAFNAVEALDKKGLIIREKVGAQSFRYSIKPLPVGIQSNHIPSDNITLGDTVPLPVGIQLDEKPLPLRTIQHKDSKEKKEKIRASRKIANAQVDKSPHQLIMDAYQESLGYAIRDGPKEGNAAKWLVKNGYTPEQVQTCYDHLKAQPFWREKHISLQTVAGQIGAYVQSKNGHTNGKLIRQSAGGNPERKPQVEADHDAGW